MKRETGKFFAVLLTCALVLSSVGLTLGKASAKELTLSTGEYVKMEGSWRRGSSAPNDLNVIDSITFKDTVEVIDHEWGNWLQVSNMDYTGITQPKLEVWYNVNGDNLKVSADKGDESWSHEIEPEGTTGHGVYDLTTDDKVIYLTCDKGLEILSFRIYDGSVTAESTAAPTADPSKATPTPPREPSKAVWQAADGKNYTLSVKKDRARVTLTGSWDSVQNMGFFIDRVTEANPESSTKDFSASVNLTINNKYKFTNIGEELTCAYAYGNGIINMYGKTGDTVSSDDGSAILYIQNSTGVYLRVGGDTDAANTKMTTITYDFTFTNWYTGVDETAAPGGEATAEPGTEATPAPDDSTPAPGGDATPAPGDSTPAPGGNTPAPGGDDATPAPGGNTTPAPGGNTPAPGANATPAPGGNVAPGTNNTPDTNNTPGTVTAPKKVTLKKVKSTKKKTVLVQWKKVSGATGYKVQIAKDKKFKKGKKTYTVKNAKTTKKTIKKLKSKKKYFARVCAYTKASGKTVTGKWSKVKKVKVK